MHILDTPAPHNPRRRNPTFSNNDALTSPALMAVRFSPEGGVSGAPAHPFRHPNAAVLMYSGPRKASPYGWSSQRGGGAIVWSQTSLRQIWPRADHILTTCFLTIPLQITALCLFILKHLFRFQLATIVLVDKAAYGHLTPTSSAQFDVHV